VSLPNFQEFMRPVLVLLSDGKTWNRAEIREGAATALNLPEEERTVRNERGTWILASRVHWATAYMFQARLIDRVGRGQVQITDRGREVLANNPGRIDVALLKQFPEFVEFLGRSGARKRDVATIDEPATEADDPYETLEDAALAIKNAVASELLQKVKAQKPVFLEHTILQLMRNMGYGASDESAKHLGGSGDEGFYGVIHQDALGLERVYLQAKRWKDDSTVGRPEVQKFAGALQGAKATRGVFITTSRFTADALKYAANLPTRVVLIDGLELAELMVQYRVGVHVRETFDIVQVDDDFFDE
jgi:restriction system protein